MKTRYRKVIRDLTTDYAKNLMLVLAIAIGVFGIGTILGGYSILKREMAKNYLGTNPASATIKIEGASFQQNLVDSVSQMEGILQAERHATITSRMKIGDDWYPLLLFVVADFKNIKTNKITSISGDLVPQPGTMLVERTSHRVMLSKEGTNILVKTPNGKPRSIRISGTVHDPGLAPAWQEKTGYAYITESTLKLLGETQGFDELRITVSEEEQTIPKITEKTKQLCIELEKRGYNVHEVQIPPPLRHPHQGQMNAVLLLFTLFSFLLLILSSILVATVIATLMTKQIREIGIMKTLGAKTKQIAMLYFVMIFSLCAGAILFAIPISQHAASGFAGKIATLLNLVLFDVSIPYWVPFVQIVAGLLFPLVSAFFPVWRGSRISVRKAMDNYGVSEKSQGRKSWISGVIKPEVFGDVFALSVRNIFRQRSRLAMTIGLLAAGGAMFITALNVSKAWDANLQKIAQQRFYDLDIRLNQFFPEAEIEKRVRTFTGISSFEISAFSSTSMAENVSYNIDQTYPDKGHGSFLIMGLPLPNKMIKLPLLEGQWLSPKGGNDVVLNHMAHALSPDLKVGDSVSLTVDDKPMRWRIIGFSEDLYSPAAAYVSKSSFQKGSGIRTLANMIRFKFTNHDQANVGRMAREIESAFNKNNISIYQSVPITLFRNAIGEHMGVLVSSLIAMAILMAIVGTLGLASAMSMNIMERTREIGIMRSIGATPAVVRKIVLIEGMLTGLMSIVFAFLVSMILSFYLGQFLGAMAFRSPLSLTISVWAIIIWIGIVILGSIAATLYPAQRANRISTREALAYE